MEPPTVTLLPGTGVGAEIAGAVMRVMESVGSPVQWEVVEQYTEVTPAGEQILRPAVLDSIKRNKVALKGPYDTLTGVGHIALHQQLRRGLNLFANVRPARTRRAENLYDNVDIVTIRENTEGEYSGLEHEAAVGRLTADVQRAVEELDAARERVDGQLHRMASKKASENTMNKANATGDLAVVDGVVENLKIITATASTRIARFAFKYAESQDRTRVTACHKAGVMKLSDGLFLECCREVAEDFPHITYEEMEMDRLVLLLASRPERFDVLCMPNLYGDIASDMAAGLVGGLGLIPSANIGQDVAVFETVHGTAPDIAGQDKGNPTALLLCAVLMLDHMGLNEEASRVEAALMHVLKLPTGRLTEDLGGTATCSQFTDAICEQLERN